MIDHQYLVAYERIKDRNTPAINVLTLYQGNEKYTFIYPDEKIEQISRTLMHFVEDPNLSFNWGSLGTVFLNHHSGT